MEENDSQKVGLTTGQSLAIGTGAALTALAVVGGVCLGRKLYKKAREEDWGEQLRERAEDMVESIREKADQVAEMVEEAEEEE